MEKLIVKLPAIRKSVRNNLKACTESETSTSKYRVQRYRDKIKNDGSKIEMMKAKKKEENRKYKEKLKMKRDVDKRFDQQMKVNQKMWTQKWRKKKNKEEQDTHSTKAKSIHTKTPKRDKKTRKNASVRKSAERVRKVLPDSPKTWANTIQHIVRNATPRRKSLLVDQDTHASVEEVLNINKVGRPRKEIQHIKKKLAFSNRNSSLWAKTKTLNRYKMRKNAQILSNTKSRAFKAAWSEKVNTFLQDNSRVMPNKKDTVIIDGTHVPKRHLLCSKLETYKKFKKDNPSFPRKFISFLKMMPKNYRCLNLACRRVCVCLKDYNLDQKINAINKAAKQNSLVEIPSSSRQLSDLSICPYDKIPHRQCIDRECEHCGTDSIKNLYEPLIQKCPSTEVKYHQWEQISENYTYRKGETKLRWSQKERKKEVKDVVNEVAQEMKTFTSHMFRSDYQHRVKTEIVENLPIDQCLVVMDFSENITIQPQDEIESSHWTQQQVTLHPIYIVRHGSESTLDTPVIMKESLIIVSDNLTHNADAVYVYT